MRWVAAQIAEQDPNPAWEVTCSKAIMKASFSCPAKFLWAIMKSWIRLMLADNILIPNHAILVTNILDGYEID